jgi:hypothetical protein
MFTKEELEFLSACSPNEIMKGIIEKCGQVNAAYRKPQIVVTINGGSYQWAIANTDILLIIEDLDNIKTGSGLYYAAPYGSSQDEFDNYLREAERSVALANAKLRKEEKIKDVRIFIHDPEDEYPFQLMLNDDVVSAHLTLEEANEFLQEYLKVRNQ